MLQRHSSPQFGGGGGAGKHLVITPRN